MREKMTDKITAVFDSEMHAEQAINDLRRMGMDDDQLSLVAPHRERGPEGEEVEGESTGERAGKGALTGAGVGLLFGLAAALIPGAGPFIAAGWLASALGITAGAAVSAVVGATAGAVAGALTRAGYTHEEATYYGEAVEHGGTLVAIDITDGTLTEAEVRAVLARHGGRSAGGESIRRAA